MHKNFTGIILRNRPFTEKDLIVSILTEEGLHVECVAKGAATEGSKRRAHLEAMNQISGTFYQGKTHQYLQSPRSERSFARLKSNLDCILKAQLLLEIVSKGVHPEDPHPEIYEALLDTLQELNKKDVHPFSAESGLIRITHYLGFLPSFKECHHCHAAIDNDEGRWDTQHGGLYCPKCSHERNQPFPLKFRKAIEFFRHAPQEHVRQLHIQEEERAKLGRFVNEFLLTHFKGRLRTLEMMEI